MLWSIFYNVPGSEVLLVQIVWRSGFLVDDVFMIILRDAEIPIWFNGYNRLQVDADIHSTFQCIITHTVLLTGYSNALMVLTPRSIYFFVTIFFSNKMTGQMNSYDI